MGYSHYYYYRTKKITQHFVSVVRAAPPKKYVVMDDGWEGWELSSSRNPIPHPRPLHHHCIIIPVFLSIDKNQRKRRMRRGRISSSPPFSLSAIHHHAAIVVIVTIPSFGREGWCGFLLDGPSFLVPPPPPSSSYSPIRLFCLVVCQDRHRGGTGGQSCPWGHSTRGSCYLSKGFSGLVW